MKTMKTKGLIQFEIIITVLVSFFRFIRIPMLWHGSTTIRNIFILIVWELNFHSLEVVDRVSETQLQVGENSD